MILPRRIRTERQRADVSAGLRALTGYVLIWKGRDQTTSPPQQHQYPEITLQMRQEVLDALLSQTDLEQHIWIAVGPIEHPKVLVSLLHAELYPETGARVDLLLSIYERNHTQAMAYDGFGELSALTLVLERLGITRLEVLLPIDADRAGLTYAGWIKRTPGVFVWEKPAGAEPSH